MDANIKKELIDEINQLYIKNESWVKRILI